MRGADGCSSRKVWTVLGLYKLSQQRLQIHGKHFPNFKYDSTIQATQAAMSLRLHCDTSTFTWIYPKDHDHFSGTQQESGNELGKDLGKNSKLQKLN
jgi:hypothetical protein